MVSPFLAVHFHHCSLADSGIFQFPSAVHFKTLLMLGGWRYRVHQFQMHCHACLRALDYCTLPPTWITLDLSRYVT
jgi:hypothetical protein